MPKELQEAVRASHGQTVRLADPDTHTEYVVLPAKVYDRMEGVLYDDSPLTSDEREAVLVKAGLRAGWDDPDMDVYDDLDRAATRFSRPM